MSKRQISDLNRHDSWLLFGMKDGWAHWAEQDVYTYFLCRSSSSLASFSLDPRLCRRGHEGTNMLELVFLLLFYISFRWVSSSFSYNSKFSYKSKLSWFVHFSHCHIQSLLQNCNSQAFVVLCLWSGQSRPIAGLMIEEESLMINSANYDDKYILQFGKK